MNAPVVVPLLLALGCYVTATAGFATLLLTKKSALGRVSLIALMVGLALHVVGKATQFVEVGALPVSDPMEAMGMLAFVTGALFVFAAWRYQTFVLGCFATPLCVVSLAANLAFGQAHGDVPEALRSSWFPIHLMLSVSADAFLALAGAISVAYLVQDKLLRDKKLGVAFRNLPPLHVLDEMSYRFISVGFLLMSLGMAAGSVFAQQRWGQFWSWDPKQTWTLMTWFLFAGILHARLTAGWRGRKAAWLTLLAVVAVLFAVVGTGAFVHTRHGGEFR